ncbi:MAG TPA: DUF4382 domain-containing protein [Dehalococcoidia bacterium]|nr:DUF4382 domain-containing protein [Dehalococcoidia bacterium]
MAEGFDRILDECIDRINRGENLADCLSDYPAYSEKLEPLLQSVHDVQKAYTFTPSADRKRAARQKFQAALGQRRQMTPVLSFFEAISRPAVWATVAALILAIVGILVIRAGLNSPTLVPSPEGNFAFLIRDDPNDIGDFENLDLTISRVTLQAAGSQKWLEFTPEIKTVDLTQLQGGQSQEIWRGNVPAGRYSQVHVYVSEVKGKLGLTGQTVDLKLPGGKVHMSMPFEVTVGMVTSFNFDITAVATGNHEQYILKLQINGSGAQQEQKPLE